MIVFKMKYIYLELDSDNKIFVISSENITHRTQYNIQWVYSQTFCYKFYVSVLELSFKEENQLLSNVFSGDKNVDFGGTPVSDLLGTTTCDGDNNQMLSIGVQ